MTESRQHAWFHGWYATDLVDVTTDLTAVASGGWWAVVTTFEGESTCARFRTVRRADPPRGRWRGVPKTSWSSSLSQHQYQQACRATRDYISRGEVYQANICRLLTAPVTGSGFEAAGLHALLRVGNPAPFGGFLDIDDMWVVTASPELYLEGHGTTYSSGPIKGTGRTEADLQDKDRAENVMIVDLVRNDLSIVCEPGSVTVPHLLAVEHHPGLVHLVSTVTGEAPESATVADVVRATFPPGSVSGAPKKAALDIICELESGPRGPYCGAVGYVDSDSGTSRLAVGIRSFYKKDSTLTFGTGAGITWRSDPEAEWFETVLKADTLTTVASRQLTS